MLVRKPSTIVENSIKVPPPKKTIELPQNPPILLLEMNSKQMKSVSETSTLPWFCLHLFHRLFLTSPIFSVIHPLSVLVMGFFVPHYLIPFFSGGLYLCSCFHDSTKWFVHNIDMTNTCKIWFYLVSWGPVPCILIVGLLQIFRHQAPVSWFQVVWSMTLITIHPISDDLRLVF